MKYLLILMTVLLLTVYTSCDVTQKIEVTVKNNTNIQIHDALVEIPVPDLKDKYPDLSVNTLLVYHRDKQLPFQLDDRDRDGQPDVLVLVMDLKPEQSAALTLISAKDTELKKEYTKRTQAEVSHKSGGKFEDKKYIGGKFTNVSFVRVPPEHTDHNTYFRYEGPGWESDKVGYRFYLDWRNATDIFGKKTSEMVLQNVGQDGFDSYHEMADWGMDVLKVGSTLGIGSVAMWHDDQVNMVSVTDSIHCTILADGPVYSTIKTDYYGWQVGSRKYDLESRLSIAAGDRKTKHDVVLTGDASNISTGLVKHENAALMESNTTGVWQYLATYGAQTLVSETDLLGMAILYKKSQLTERIDDGQSHVLVLSPDEGKLTYYFLAAWGQEPGGITDSNQFKAYLERELVKMDNPVSIAF